MQNTPRATVLSLLHLPAATSREAVRATLLTIPDAVLVNIWQAVWPESKSAFAHSYHLNSGNFSRWTNGRTTYPLAAQAVQNYLLSLVDNEMPEQRAAPQALAHEFTAAWALLEQQLPSADIVILLDADQVVEAAKKVRWLFAATTAIHVVAVATLGAVVPTWWPLDERWLWIRAPSSAKQITDVVLTTLADRIPTVTTAKLVLVSRDYFIQAVVILLRSQGVIAYLQNPTSHNLDLLLLLLAAQPYFTATANSLWQLLSGDLPNDATLQSQLTAIAAPAHITVANIRDALATLTATLDETTEAYPRLAVSADNSTPLNCNAYPDLLLIANLLKNSGTLQLSRIGQLLPWNDERSKLFGSRNWREALLRIDVLTCLQADLWEISASAAELRPHQASVNSEDDQLRNFFRSHWSSSTTDFAAQYHLNHGDFIGWLLRRRLIDPRSSQAVRTWIHTVSP